METGSPGASSTCTSSGWTMSSARPGQNALTVRADASVVVDTPDGYRVGENIV